MMGSWIALLLGIGVLALAFVCARMPLRYWAVGADSERYKRTVRAINLVGCIFLGLVFVLMGIARLVGQQSP